MSPAEMKILSSQLTRQWHFWLNLCALITESMITAGMIPAMSMAGRVATGLLTLSHGLGYAGAAIWQAPRRAWSEEEKINHFRDEIAAYERRQR